MRSGAVVCAVLACSLALSCYPFARIDVAYADGPFQGQETENERSEERGAVGSGDEPREVAEEPEDDSEAGEGAAEGVATSPSLPEVPSGSDSGSGGFPAAGLDGASEDAYSSGGRDSESAVSDELAIQPFVDSFSVIDTLVASAWTGEGTQFVIGENKIAARNGTIIWAVLAAADILESVLDELERSNNYLKAIDTASKSLAESFSNFPSSFYEMSMYVYNIMEMLRGDIMGEPFWFLKAIGWEILGNSHGGVSLYDVIAQIRDDGEADSKLLSKGLSDLLTSLNATMSYVSYINDKMALSNSYDVALSRFLSKGFDDVLSALGELSNGDVVDALESILEVSQQSNGLLSKGLSDILAAVSTLSFSGDGSYVVRCGAYMYMSSFSDFTNFPDNNFPCGYQYIRYYPDSCTISLFIPGTIYLGKAVQCLPEYDSSFSTIAFYSSAALRCQSPFGYFSQTKVASDFNTLYGQWYDFNLSYDSLMPGFRYTFLLPFSIESKNLAYPCAYSIRFTYDDLMSAVSGSSGSVSADFSEVSDAISALGDSLGGKLDAINRLLVTAGLVENGKDLLDFIFGDLSGIGQAAATGAIQSAMESAFPFCIPALVKQVFGLLSYEGSAPVWVFDICGNSLVCDFSGFQLVADYTSWLSRLTLVLVLLVNTRKFVFAVNGGGAS